MSQVSIYSNPMQVTPNNQSFRSYARPSPRVSRGGLDEINPEDIVYGEYSSDRKQADGWIDLVYLDDNLLRTYSGAINLNHPIVDELKIILRNEEMFYLVPIREVPLGIAFKRRDITDIKVASVIEGNENHVPSCVWTILFEDGKKRVLEAQYQAYFAYGNTTRPLSMTNTAILDGVFEAGKRGDGHA